MRHYANLNHSQRPKCDGSGLGRDVVENQVSDDRPHDEVSVDILHRRIARHERVPLKPGFTGLYLLDHAARLSVVDHKSNRSDSSKCFLLVRPLPKRDCGQHKQQED